MIDNPNNYGPGLNFLPASISLSGKICVAGMTDVFTGNYNFSPQFDFTTSFINCFVRFTVNTNITGSNEKWYWNFGDGKIDSGLVVDHSYRNSGTYNVKLTLQSTSACGIIDTFSITRPITINNIFSVDFDYSGSCVNQPFQFSDSTKLTVGNITGWNWEFGDGNSSTLQNPAHNYSSPGVYSVKFVVSTNGICRADSITKTIYVDSRPVADFTFNNGCINQNISFSDISTNNTGNINNWNWNFGDGNTDTIQNPGHTYSNYGNYNMSLTVSSEHGCSAGITKPIIIEDIPVADFDFSEPCFNQPISFNDNSAIVFGNITNWQWNFGDNTNSSISNPIHIYSQEADYPVSLKVTSTYGCVSTPKTSILNVRKVNANAGRDTTAILNWPLQLQGSGGITYQWDPPIGLNDANIQNPISQLTNDMSYVLRVINLQGCTGFDTINIKVYAKYDIYVPTGFTPNGDGKNDQLKPICVGIKELTQFSVYNRWGQLVFNTKQIGKGWDGKFNGQAQPTSTVVWIVKGITFEGKIIERKGTATLIR